MYNVEGVMFTVNTEANTAASSIDKLTKSLAALKAITKGSLGLSKVSADLAKLNAALSGISSTGTARLGKVATAMTNIKNAANSATAPVKKLSAAMNGPGAASGSGGMMGWLRFGVAFAVLRRGIQALGSVVNKSNEYVENLNLFTVSMGEYADQALDYANKVQDAMGVDASEWIRNQGVFKQIASGIGMAGDQAYYLSQGLTQVAYDISSFFNISTEDAMQKVQSGISGELEPLRRLGYALDQATLQQVAYTNGVNMKISAMTQAQKAELRYVAIMQQSQNAIGDMARTINTGANQIRIMQSQLSLLARAFGNLLIPAVNAVLPVLIAFVNTLTSVINSIANLFGFSLPTIDYSGISGAGDAAGDLGNNLGNAGGSAKKLKNILMGFDELNVMQDTASGGGGGGGGGGIGGGGSLGFDLSEYLYDFMDGLQSRITTLTPLAKTLAFVLAGLVIAPGLLGDFLTFKNYLATIGTMLLGVASAVLQIKLTYEFMSGWFKSGDASYLWMTTAASAVSGLLLAGVIKRLGWQTTTGGALKTGMAVSLGIDALTTLYAQFDAIKENPSKKWSKESIVAGLKTILDGVAVAGLLGWGRSGMLLTGAAALALTLNVQSVAAAAADGGVKNLTTLDWISSIGSAALAGGLTGFKLGGVSGAVIGAVVAGGISVAATLIALSVEKGDTVGVAWGAAKLTQEEIQSLASSLLDANVTQKITVVGTEIEKSATYTKNYETAVDNFRATLGLLNVYSGVHMTADGITVTPLTEAQLVELDSGIKAVVEAGQSSLSQQVVKVSAMVQLFEASEDGTPTGLGKSIILNAESINNSISGELALLGESLGKAYADAYADGIVSWDEQAAIQAILDKMLIVQQAIDAYNTEYEWSMFVGSNGLTSLDKDSFFGAFDKYQGYLEEQRAALRTSALEFESALRGKASAASVSLNLYDPGTPEYTKALDDYRLSVQNLAQTLGVDLAGVDLSTPEKIAEVLSGLPPLDVEAYIKANMDLLSQRGNELFRQALIDIFGGSGLGDTVPENLRYFMSGIDPTIVETDVFVANLQKYLGDTLEGTGITLEMLGQIGMTGWELVDADVKQQLYDIFSDVLGENEAKKIFSGLGITLKESLTDTVSGALDGTPTSSSTVGGKVQSFIGNLLGGVSGKTKSNETVTALGSVKAGAENASKKLVVLETGIGDCNTALTALSEITATATVNLDDKASKPLAEMSKSLASVKGTFTSRLNVTATVSSVAGSIASALSAIVRGSSSSMANAFSKIYKYSLLATGGIPAQGTMFMAGEAGPELVGMVGNRTGVANREQISDIIASDMARHGGGGASEEAIARAVARALDGAAVMLDGDQFGRLAIKSINRAQRRSGRNELTLQGG